MNILAPTNMEERREQESTILPNELIWRRNCPYMYSLLYVSELDWPSLTVDWVSAYQSSRESLQIQNAYNMVLGTQTDSEQNYIILAKTRVPNQAMLRKKYQKERPPKTETVKKNDELMPEKIQILSMIPHDGQVNRLRHNPLQLTRVASKTTNGQIHIFNTTSYKKDKVAPEIILSGHDTQGYALEWNTNRKWYIISGSYDGKLSLWDSDKKQTNNVVTPLINFNFHKKEIEDVSYNKFHESIFLSCDDEGQTAVWDSRNCSKSPTYHFVAHKGPQYGCQFSPSSEYNFLTCGSDSLIKVWDLRNLSSSIFTCGNPGTEEVIQVQWSREDPATAWSVAGAKATLWDLSTETAKFVHACRSSQNSDNQVRINELSVNINQPDTVAVVDSNNEVHVFQPNQNAKI